MTETYEDLLQRVWNEGVERPDRTGTGTIGIFGGRIEYDLRRHFPLITSKQVFFRGIVAELFWMLSGDTNVKALQDQGVHIWNEWTDDSGELGPVYGAGWRDWGGSIDRVPQPTPNLPEGVEPTYLGVANGTGKTGHPLGKTWEGMISRCYNPKNPSYPEYGGRGVSVCDRWLVFRNFAEDAEKLPGYEAKLSSPVRYVLDKDARGLGLKYSPETCTWLTDAENAAAGASKLYTVEDAEGVQYSFTSPTNFCREQGIPDGNLNDLWTGRKNAKVRHGYRLVSVKDLGAGVDQIANVLNSLKSDPYSRRHVVTAWQPDRLGYMALAPCHILFQFNVEPDGLGGDYLDIQVYQRSADMFLGVPFNIASYALLNHLVAKHLGYRPRKLVWVGGDCHIYGNHTDQVEQQLAWHHEHAIPLPALEITGDRVFDENANLTPDDFEIDLQGYDPRPTLRAPVAV